jgi:predicted component of type VI protein secretion system
MKLGLLVLTAGKQEGKVLEIKLPQFLIGRDPDCQLRPASPMISKRHCAVIQRDDKAFIRDFGSTNGTYLNEERVEGEQELKNDDQLKVGPILFAVRIEQDASAPTVTSPTPAPATKPALATTPAPATRPVTKTAPAANATPAPATTKAPVSATPTPATTKAPVSPTPAPVATKAPASATPAPATTKAPVSATKPSSGGGEDDVDIAAMLLSLEDGDSPASTASADAIPDGSTVMDLKIPEDILAGKPPEKKPDPKAKANTGDTRSAAAKILDQMTRRPRN